MVETTGPSLPPSSTARKTNPWLIIIVVVVVLCCFCIGATGLLIAFGQPILDELGLLNALLPIPPIMA
jgi:hypothetical protein